MFENASIDFQQLAESSPIMLIFLDEERRLVWGNQLWKEYTGHACDTALPAAFAIHCDEQEKFTAAVADVYENPLWISYELSYQRHDGNYRRFQLHGKPCLHGDKVVGLVCALLDITDQQMVEEQILALNDSLEAMVAERTRDLQQAHDELKAAQSQMLQHEKMATVGQLAAGVAHEINNPMGFITSNLGSLKKYLNRFSDFIEYQQQLLVASLDDTGRKELATKRKSLKVDYLLEDSDDLIAESLDGAERVQQIVGNLKSFSRVDQAEQQLTDINECLDSTLAIAWNELKYKVTLEKDYADLPPLLCYPQQLNQVFMNLLINAAQVIPDKGTVQIRTRSDEGFIYIDVVDSGCGIPAEHLSHIFEPFFTTKEVGKGTGLGMSISYEIVKKHDGDIRIESVEGQGTTVTVELPLVQEGGG